MRIEFERSGGFMGVRNVIQVDTTSLEPQEANELLALVESAGFFDLPEHLASSTPAADTFQYRLTIERSEIRHTVMLTDSATPDSLQPLLQRLNLLARNRRLH